MWRGLESNHQRWILMRTIKRTKEISRYIATLTILVLITDGVDPSSGQDLAIAAPQQRHGPPRR